MAAHQSTKKSLAAVLLLTVVALGAPAWAEVETFRLEWASVDTYIQEIWSAGAELVTLESWTDGSDHGYHLTGLSALPDFYFICHDPVNCAVNAASAEGGIVVQRIPGSPGAATLQLDLRWYGHSAGQLIGAGIKVVAPPSPPPSPLKVVITQPKATATVSGTAWIVLWVEGTSGAYNTFTLSADGVQIATRTTTTRGPVAIPWPTLGLPNGAHTLTGTVRDATGKTGTTALSVMVTN